MAGKVLDSYSLLCYLEGDAGSQELIGVFQQARDSDKNIRVSAVSWGEVYAALEKELGKSRADDLMHALETLPVEVIDVDAATAKQAASLRVARGLAYECSFAAALAKQRKATLVTGNRSLGKLNGEIKIKWLEGESIAQED